MAFCLHLTVKKYYNISILFGVFFLFNCESDKKIDRYEKFTIDKSLPKNDTIRLLSAHPELKLFLNEKIESPARTACIIQRSSYSDGFYSTLSFQFEDYKCKSEHIGDTVNIWLNNNNGYFGNGVLVKVFKDRFLIKDIDPKTLKGEIKFITSAPIYQKLALNKSSFKQNDSIYGYISYTTKIDYLVTKNFKGYFKTIIK